MMDRNDITSNEVDERTELLINRYLDGALSDSDQAELHVILGRDAAARAMFEQYLRNDALAAQALRRGVENTITVAAPRHRRGLWIATVASGLAAAAVIVFSISSRLQYLPGGPNVAVRNGTEIKFVDPQQYPTFEPVKIEEVPARLVDYRDDDLMPKRRQQKTDRELIGVRGDDGRLYIIERNVKSTRVAPMAGEY